MVVISVVFFVGRVDYALSSGWPWDCPANSVHVFRDRFAGNIALWAKKYNMSHNDESSLA